MWIIMEIKLISFQSKFTLEVLIISSFQRTSMKHAEDVQFQGLTIAPAHLPNGGIIGQWQSLSLTTLAGGIYPNLETCLRLIQPGCQRLPMDVKFSVLQHFYDSTKYLLSFI